MPAWPTTSPDFAPELRQLRLELPLGDLTDVAEHVSQHVTERVDALRLQLDV